MKRHIPNSNSIIHFIHCGLCMDEYKGKGVSPREYAQLEFGWTELGLQVWCKRHDCNVMHMDFDGRKIRTNDTRPRKPGETKEDEPHDPSLCACCGEPLDKPKGETN